MSLIIRKNLFKGNVLVALLGSVSLSAIFGTILYHTVGWQQSTLLSAALFIIAAIITHLLASELPTHYENRDKKFWLFNAIIFAETLTCFWYAFHHTANDWIGSPWQTVSYKFILALFFVIASTALATIYKKISSRIFFFVVLLLLSINTII